jgi:hypothetical protein
MTCGSACGGWEKCCMVGEHMCITNLFLNNFIRMKIFFEIFASWMIILNAWIPDNWEFMVFVLVVVLLKPG